MTHPSSGQPGGSERFDLFSKAAKMCLKLAYGCRQMARPVNAPQAGADWLGELVRRLAQAHELLPECERTLAQVSRGIVPLHIKSRWGPFDEHVDSGHHAALVVAELVVVRAYEVLTLPVPRACLWTFPR